MNAVHQQRFWAVVLIAASTAGCSRGETGATTHTDSEAQETSAIGQQPSILSAVPFDKRHSVILLPVTIQDREYKFLLDSGSTLHVFDTSLRHFLDEPVHEAVALSSGVPVGAQAFYAPAARVGQVPFDRQELVICADLAVLRTATGEQVDGILGMSFLKRHRIQVDWDDAELRVLDPRAKPDPTWGREVPAGLDHLEGPTVLAKVSEDGDISFLLDTGADSTGSLLGHEFDRAVENGQLHITGSQTLATASGTVNRPTGRLAMLWLGSFDHGELIFSRSESNTLGLRYLKRYCTTFDLPNGRIYLRPSEVFGERDQDDMSGLRIIRRNDDTIILRVEPNSPAAGVGLQAGDVIVSVDGKPARDLTLSEIRRLLRSQPGRGLKIVCRRDAGLVQRQIILRQEPWEDKQDVERE